MSGLRIENDGGCWLDNELLHPPRQPLMAAQREMESILGELDANDTLVIIGPGLGWHIKAALQKLKPEQIIIYQALPDERNWQLCLGPELPDLSWLDNAQDLAAALGQRLVYQDIARQVALYVPPAYARLMPALIEQVRAQLNRAVRRANKDRQTRQTLAATWGKHLADNAHALFALPDIFMSAGAFASVPALVVGAGPSLDQSLPLLKHMRHKALVLGAASVLGPMAGHGLRPHLVVALEGKDESRQFVNVDYEKTVLLASLNGHPNHFVKWEGMKSYFQVNTWLPRILNWGGLLPTGGHATSAAFSLACLWGCSPIILIGQDLAYTGGKVHANARPGGEEEQRQLTINVPALGGGMVETSSVMQSYLEWYEEAASYLRHRRPELRVINATAGGAEIAGFAWQELGATLDSLPMDEDRDLRLLLQNTDLLHPALAAPGLTQAAGLVERSFRSAADLREALANSLLHSWLDEELVEQNWRQSLAHLRLLLNRLLKKL